jgi:hypothetical protein
MSEKKDQEYLSDGMSEELINLLSKVSGTSAYRRELLPSTSRAIKRRLKRSPRRSASRTCSKVTPPPGRGGSGLGTILARGSPRLPYGIARIYAMRGDRSTALDWLARAYPERDQ